MYGTQLSTWATMSSQFVVLFSVASSPKKLEVFKGFGQNFFNKVRQRNHRLRWIKQITHVFYSIFPSILCSKNRHHDSTPCVLHKASNWNCFETLPLRGIDWIALICWSFIHSLTQNGIHYHLSNNAGHDLTRTMFCILLPNVSSHPVVPLRHLWCSL